MSELNTIDNSLPPTDVFEDTGFDHEAGAVSPYWPSTERSHFQDMGLGDTVSVNETIEGIDGTNWNGSSNVTLERCMSCISKLGAISRSSTAVLTPGATHFNPAWTMEAVHETHSDIASEYDTQEHSNKSSQLQKSEEICKCLDKPPERPPKPTKLDLISTKKPPMPLPIMSCNCNKTISLDDKQNCKIGPYENYDIPKSTFNEVGTHYS